MNGAAPSPDGLRFPPNMRAVGSGAAAITACPVLTVYPHARARTPRRLGFNVEVQIDHDRINLWDWLADSGATVVREFHPEVDMRRALVRPGVWGAIGSRADYDAFRARLCADPRGGIDWGNYRFGDAIRWLGVPDAIVGRLDKLGIYPMIPMGYVPKMFPRPLVKDPENLAPADEARIDWEAAASAYEYYLAMVYHFAADFGCRTFMMVNEPEYRFGGYYLPARIEAIVDKLFVKLFRELDDLVLWDTYFRALAVQTTVLTRIARDAVDDAARLLAVDGRPAALVLSGPAAGNLDAYWAGIRESVHCCDYHQYSPYPEAYRERFRRAAALVRGTGQTIAISEFNRQAGEMQIDHMYFPLRESLGLASILAELLQVSRTEDPELSAATLYHFAFPATHRNYKSLVYGDMNRVDWSGRDARPREPELYPTTDELQIRFATPAYHMFRMFARCAGFDPATGDPYPVLETSVAIRDTARIPDLSNVLRVLAVDQGERLIVTLVNPDPARGDTFTIDLRSLRRAYGWAVIRETGAERCDQVTGEVAVVDGAVRVSVAPESLVQVIFSDRDPGTIVAPRLEETTETPGVAAALGLWQTTRLRVMAECAGRPVDLTTHNVIWESEQPDLVRVGQGGLVQRVRTTDRVIVVRARLADGRTLGEVRVRPPPT